MSRNADNYACYSGGGNTRLRHKAVSSLLFDRPVRSNGHAARRVVSGRLRVDARAVRAAMACIMRAGRLNSVTTLLLLLLLLLLSATSRMSREKSRGRVQRIGCQDVKWRISCAEACESSYICV